MMIILMMVIYDGDCDDKDDDGWVDGDDGRVDDNNNNDDIDDVIMELNVGTHIKYYSRSIIYLPMMVLFAFTSPNSAIVEFTISSFCWKENVVGR